jgi:hypothetical protein
MGSSALEEPKAAWRKRSLETMETDEIKEAEKHQNTETVKRQFPLLLPPPHVGSCLPNFPLSGIRFVPRSPGRSVDETVAAIAPVGEKAEETRETLLQSFSMGAVGVVAFATGTLHVQ